MKKLYAPIIAATFAASTFLSPISIASAYDNSSNPGNPNGYDNPYYNGNQSESNNQNGQNPEYGSGQQNGGDYFNKGAEKQLLSIDKQLMKVEELIVKYQNKFEKMTTDDDKDNDKDKDKDKNQDKDNDRDKDKVIDQNQEQQPTEENSGLVMPLSVSKAPVESQEEDAAPSEKPLTDKEKEKAEKQADKDKEKAEKQAQKDKEEAEKQAELDKEKAEDEQEKAEEEAEDKAEKEEDLAEELEEAVEEYNDYTGKFTSLSHRLDGISSQLDSLATRISDPALLTSRYERIEQLRLDLTAATDKINGIQNTVIKKIKNDYDAEVKPEAPVEDALKPWNIKFSKPLDEQAISELNVVVVDSANNLIATTTTYDIATRSLAITPQQAYKTGERYTLFIDKEIKSHNGKTLKKSIKKTFYVK